MTNHKYTKELLTEAVSNSFSYAGVLRYLNVKQAGGNHTNISRQIKNFEIDTSHFTGKGHNKGKISNKRRTAAQIMVIMPDGSGRESVARLRRAMAEVGIDEVCSECGVDTEWNYKPIQLEVDHIDGNWLNNLQSNLRYLCPNCHSQQVNTNLPHKNRS